MIEENTNRKKPGKARGKRRRSALEIARDRAEIVTLRLRYRYSTHLIAAKINEQYTQPELLDEEGREIFSGKFPPTISFEQVKKELLAAKEDFKANLEETIQDKRIYLIRGYEDVALQAQLEFEESKKDRLVITKESRVKDGETTEVEKEVVEGKHGNPRFLDILEKCLTRIAELEGAFMPRKTALTNPEGTESIKFTSEEEFKRLEIILKDVLPIPRG